MSSSFILPQYVVTHDEDLAPGSDIVNVSAITQSPPVTYAIVSDTLSDAYFAMESQTGRIYLRQRFTNDPDSRLQYDMLVTARDSSGSVAQSRVRVIVLRNKNTPVFVQARNVTIFRYQAVNQPITRVIANDADRAGTPSATVRYAAT